MIIKPILVDRRTYTRLKAILVSKRSVLLAAHSLRQETLFEGEAARFGRLCRIRCEDVGLDVVSGAVLADKSCTADQSGACLRTMLAVRSSEPMDTSLPKHARIAAACDRGSSVLPD
jgi:hypothetical protein